MEIKASDDDWDKVVCIENYAEELGRREAEADYEENKTAMTNGRTVGFMKGYEIAFELSFYNSTVQSYLDSITKASIAKNKEDNSWHQERNRLHRRCSQLFERVKNLPDSNDESFDFQSLLDECRSLYKLISLEGKLPQFRMMVQPSKHEW